ncbi:uncharacterized protein LOC113953267 [Corapipo altera]|uniref:uncharacterized protein LOC113953267 n=1 Tax=Corapipo altera TaxID=415028 RepID=UPI000FD65E53|nr:uncharacterized protein LOC113953267 [Corapipo altera]
MSTRTPRRHSGGIAPSGRGHQRRAAGGPCGAGARFSLVFVTVRQAGGALPLVIAFRAGSPSRQRRAAPLRGSAGGGRRAAHWSAPLPIIGVPRGHWRRRPPGAGSLSPPRQQRQQQEEPGRRSALRSAPRVCEERSRPPGAAAREGAGKGPGKERSGPVRSPRGRRRRRCRGRGSRCAVGGSEGGGPRPQCAERGQR